VFVLLKCQMLCCVSLLRHCIGHHAAVSSMHSSTWHAGEKSCFVIQQECNFPEPAALMHRPHTISCLPSSTWQARKQEGAVRPAAVAAGGVALLLVVGCAVTSFSKSNSRTQLVEYVPVFGMPDPAEAVHVATETVSQVMHLVLSVSVVLT
jgi:hypothetical protein